MIPTLRPAAALPALLLAATLSTAAEKRPLTIKDFDSWRAIASQRISPDGKYVAYGLFPQVGDGEVVVKNVDTGKEHRQAAGERPPPRERTEDEERAPTPPGVAIQFSRDCRFVVFSTFPSRAEVQAARKEKKNTGNGMVILDLSSGSAVRVPGVKGFQLPEDGDVWLAYQKEKELILRNLVTGIEKTLAGAVDYSFSKDGRSLVYTTADGIHVLQPDAQPVTLLSGKGKYLKPAWNEQRELSAGLRRGAG